MSKQIEKLARWNGFKSMEKDVLDFNSKVQQLRFIDKQIFNVAC